MNKLVFVSQKKKKSPPQKKQKFGWGGIFGRDVLSKKCFLKKEENKNRKFSVQHRKFWHIFFP